MESPGFLVWVGFAAFFFVSLIVGVRLLMLARQTRELPELLIGVGVLGIGPVGFGGSVVGTALVTQRPEVAVVAFVFGSLAVSAGVLAKFVFNWRVYHPRSELARGLIGVVALLLFGVTAYRSFSYGFAPGDPSAAPQLVQSGLLIGALLWGSFEAIRYWLLMKRRAKLGFADPVVANRFFLWGLGAGAAGLGAGLGTVVGMVTGMSQMQVPWVVASSSAHGFVAAVAISLAFVPPAAYLRWVASRDAV